MQLLVKQAEDKGKKRDKDTTDITAACSLEQQPVSLFYPFDQLLFSDMDPIISSNMIQMFQIYACLPLDNKIIPLPTWCFDLLYCGGSSWSRLKVPEESGYQ